MAATAYTARRQLTLELGSNLIDPGVINDLSPENLMIIPLPPEGAWTSVDIGSPPTATQVELVNLGTSVVTVNVFFFAPHSIIGVVQADPY
jgi:hypothetical protein